MTKTAATTARSSPDARAAYDNFLPAALGLGADDLVAFRAVDPTLARHNCELGLAAIAPERAKIKEHLPYIALAQLDALPRLALAVDYATIAANEAPPPSEVNAQLSAAHAVRGTLLTIADGLSRAGLVPTAEVTQIKKGRGARDAARDCVALAELFTSHEKKSARELGSWLLTTLKPGGARAAASTTAATEARDRLWSLLVLRHQDLRKVGYYLWGDAFGEHVPALLARHRPDARAKEPVANGMPAKPAPAAAAAPPA